MRSKKFWLRIINVYPNEWEVVRQLYIFQFFQGAGIAFFFTSAFAQFLEKYPITELPWVMVYSALLLWIAGFLYTRLEHTVKFQGFNLAVVVLMAVSVVLLWIADHRLHQDWFLYLLLAWFNVLYLLNNLQFWGIAAMLFDLRQSKRLFAVISAGDIPAKFIGYTLALIFVPYIGTRNLLLLGAICMLVSLPLFKKILESGHLEAHHNSHKKQHHGKKAHKKISTLVTNIAANTYVRRIAFISLLTSTCVILVNYGFYGEVRKAYHDDVALAKFIAFFYAALRLAAFITKMVFTSRLTASWGIRQTLFVTPIGMLIFIGAIVALGNFSASDKLIFYLFGVASMIVDVLRTSFNSPVLLTLMQPLHTYERLRAHNIVKGIMDPFASLLSGIFLLALLYMHNKVDLMFLCYVLFVLGIMWLIGVILVNRQYLQILVKTISSRYFSREEFDLNNDAVREQIRNKMMKGTDLEVISILRMLGSKIDPASENLITELLHHPSVPVRLEALKLIKSLPTKIIQQRLDNLLQDDNLDNQIKTEAVKTLCKIAAESSQVQRFLNNTETTVLLAAITGMLENRNASIKAIGEKEIESLIASGDEGKSQALAVLAEVKDVYNHPAHTRLMKDHNLTIRAAAIDATGKAAKQDTLEELANQFMSFEKKVITAFYNAGEKAVPVLQNMIHTENKSDQVQQKLITLLGKIGGEKSQKILVQLLTKKPQFISTTAKALYRSRYTAQGDARKVLERIAHTFIVCGVELLYMQKLLEKKELHYSVLNNSLEQEIREIREVLLCLFACLYDRNKIAQVKQSLSTHHRDSIANAMEIIELTVKKDIGRNFNTLFETIDIEQRCTALRSLFTEQQFGNVERILERILSEKPILYYSWTKACSMYISKKYVHPVSADLYKKYILSENKLLKETALFAGS